MDGVRAWFVHEASVLRFRQDAAMADSRVGCWCERELGSILSELQLSAVSEEFEDRARSCESVKGAWLWEKGHRAEKSLLSV